jgi:hypothetical protein
MLLQSVTCNKIGCKFMVIIMNGYLSLIFSITYKFVFPISLRGLFIVFYGTIDEYLDYMGGKTHMGWIQQANRLLAHWPKSVTRFFFFNLQACVNSNKVIKM